MTTRGPSSNQTFLWRCVPQESLITLGTTLEQIFLDNPFGPFTVCTRHMSVDLCSLTQWRAQLTCLQTSQAKLPLQGGNRNPTCAGLPRHCDTCSVVLCTAYSLQCAVYSLQCEVCSVQCTAYCVKCEVYSLQCEVYIVQPTVCIVVYSLLCIVCS